MKRWKVLYTQNYKNWWDTLDASQQAVNIRLVDKLRNSGPTLGRPDVDTLHGSKYSNMKELRMPGPIRVLFAFDPQRAAVLLHGGNKAKSKSTKVWYKKAIAKADELFSKHLARLKTVLKTS